MNVCDVCAEMGAVNCKHCKHGNPCLGCADYSEETDTCESHGGCGAKIENPHKMDKYISANNLKAKVISGEPVLFNKPTQHEIFFLLESEPSEDVAPVVHAHVGWTIKNSSCQTQCCSNCHRTFISRPDEAIEFCPHCGAKMDEKDNDNY